MSDVLSDEQAIEFCTHPRCTIDPCSHWNVRAIERAVVAALAARSGVDVEALASSAAGAYLWPEHGERISPTPIADALHLALATAEARHAPAREVYDALERHGYTNPQACTIDTICEQVDAGIRAAGPAAEAQMELAALKREHAEREAMWRQFYNLIDGRLTGDNRDDLARAIELRAALGLA